MLPPYAWEPYGRVALPKPAQAHGLEAATQSVRGVLTAHKALIKAWRSKTLTTDRNGALILSYEGESILYAQGAVTLYSRDEALLFVFRDTATAGHTIDGIVFAQPQNGGFRIHPNVWMRSTRDTTSVALHSLHALPWIAQMHATRVTFDRHIAATTGALLPDWLFADLPAPKIPAVARQAWTLLGDTLMGGLLHLHPWSKTPDDLALFANPTSYDGTCVRWPSPSVILDGNRPWIRHPACGWDDPVQRLAAWVMRDPHFPLHPMDLLEHMPAIVASAPPLCVSPKTGWSQHDKLRMLSLWSHACKNPHALAAACAHIPSPA